MKVVVGLNFPDHESTFRGILDMVDADLDSLSQRDLVMASIGVLMQMGNLPWPVISKSVKSLRGCTDERMMSDGCGIAIINGSTLLLPTEDAVEFFGMMDLRRLPEPPQAYVTTLYTVPSVWDRVGQILSE
jgi:hypothetical protein